MLDFGLIDSHVHLIEPAKFGYAWTKGAPSLGQRHLMAELDKARGAYHLDGLVFAEVDVEEDLLRAATQLLRMEPHVVGQQLLRGQLASR